MLPRHLALSLVALLATAASAFADVHRVPADFGSLQDAILAATNGDIVLVTPGSYENLVVVDGKGITLVADGGRVTLQRLRVLNVPAESMALIRGFDANANLASGGPLDALLVQDCAGAVWIEDCTFAGHWGLTGAWPLGIPSTDGYAGVRVQGCTSVALIGCSATGGVGADLVEENSDPPPTAGGPGLHVRTSEVYVTDCVLTGGDGGDIYDTVSYTGGAGGPGIENKATVHVEDSALLGGDGGFADCELFGCGDGGRGGDGILQDTGAPVVTTRDNVYLPGQGGVDGDGQGTGPDGLDTASWAGVHWPFAAPCGTMTSSSPRREGEQLLISFTGQPGDQVFLWIGFAPAHVFLLGRQGVFLVGGPYLAAFAYVGMIGPIGTVLDVPLIVPELGPGVEGGNLLFQAAFDDGVKVLLGPVTSSTLLDASF